MRMVANTFYSNLRRAFNFRFGLSVLLIALAVAADSGSSLISSFQRDFNPDDIESVVYYYLYSVSFGGVYSIYFSAMLAGFPFATGYVDELGMYPYIVHRTGVIRYCFTKMTTAALSGGMALVLGRLLFVGILLLKLPFTTPAAVLEYQWMPFGALLVSYGGAQFLSVSLLLSFLTGVLWGSAAMCISAFIPNVFAATVSPFVISFALTQFCRLARLSDGIRLDRLLSGRGWLGSTATTLFCTSISVIFLFVVCTYLFTHRLRGEVR